MQNKNAHFFINFIVKALLISAVTIGLLILLNLRYMKVMDRPYEDLNKFHYLGDVYKNVQICNVGSSHGEYAFLYDELYKQDGYECFNFGLSSQTYDYDLAILKNYSKDFSDDVLLFIPVSYFSFNDEAVNEEEIEALSVKYYHILKAKYNPKYDPYIDLVAVKVPILSAEEDLWKLFDFSITAHAQEFDDRAVELWDQGMVRVARHYGDKDKDQLFRQDRIDNLFELVEYAKSHNMTPVLITTPYSACYYDQFPSEFLDEFYQKVQEYAAQAGVNYYNYSQDDRFKDTWDYYADCDHLNEEGARVFMEVIREEIPEFRDYLKRVAPNKTASTFH